MDLEQIDRWHIYLVQCMLHCTAAIQQYPHYDNLNSMLLLKLYFEEKIVRPMHSS